MMSLGNNFSIKEGEFEPSPEEAALVMRLRIFVRLRWFAILGVIIAVLVASRVFHISFPILPVYIICAFIVLYNLVLMRQVQSLEAERGGSVIQRAKTYGHIHIFLDLVTLAVLLHFTGGIENPLFSSLCFTSLWLVWPFTTG